MLDVRPLVIYHSPCLDGFTAAWACWLTYPNAEFVPGIYGQEPPDCTGRDVYLLDFSYKLPVMEKIIKQANLVIILDHHKTAEKDLSNLWAVTPDHNVTCIFDMEKSGARLAWEWFHPGQEVPLLVRLVEDRDLWRFALPDSRELNATFFSYAYDFAQWSELAQRLDLAVDYQELVLEGKAIERKHQKDVTELVGKLRHTRHFYRARIPAMNSVYDFDVPCANVPYTMASDVAGLMAADTLFAATYYQDADGSFVFSLRSRGVDGTDVSAVALAYGGGGHRNAAGFRVKSLEEL